MILDTLDEIPFTMVWKRLLDEEATRVLMIEVEEENPFTKDIIVLPEENKPLLVIILKVEDEFNPFTLEFTVTVFVVVDTDNVFPEITEVVATTPLTLVVRVLPVTL